MGRRLPVDQEAARADAFRRRAIELAMQAKREDDPGQRRFLIDKARNLVNVADAMGTRRRPSVKFSAWAFDVEPKTMRQGMERLSGHHVLRLK
jgi:hypothetical protein